MRVLFGVTRPVVGGAQVFVTHAIRMCLEHDAQVGLIVGGAGFLTEEVRSLGVRVWKVPTLPHYDPVSIHRSYRGIRGIISKFAPDVVSGHSTVAGALVRLAAHKEGVPRIVYRSHGWPFSDGTPRWQRVLILWERYFARFTSQIVCNSEHERHIALKHGVASPEKLVVVYNGLRVDSSLRATPPSNGDVRLLFVGRFAPQKDPALFVEVVAAAIEKGLPVSATMIGDGPLRTSVIKMIDARGLRQHVELAGEVPYRAVPGIMARHHALVATSRWEAFGRMALEALSVGLPVVAVDIGGLPEVVQHQVTGLLVKSRDPRRLADAVESIVADRDLWASFSDNARRVVQERFEQDTVMEQYWGALTGA